MPLMALVTPSPSLSTPPSTLARLHVLYLQQPLLQAQLKPSLELCGIAAIEVMKMLGIRSIGLSLSFHKGLPLGSGLGSSAASAAAGIVAVNKIFGGKLGSEELVLAGLKSEEKVLGYHADNVGPTGNLRL